ncbi:MAG: sulfite exporter TauE/SafE family protein [Candidatus Sumerlaeia bacterium]|nr:sulfite exporter TauE/SafE family protein [Candidatus Sumerlaeia bacterium]
MELSMMQLLGLLIVGAFAGAMSGFFGIGGGIVMVPALVLLMGFTQQMAQGTSIAVMIPPIGLAAAIQYYRQGFVDLRVAAFVAIGFVIGSLITSTYISKVPGPILKQAFGMLMLFSAGQIFYAAGGFNGILKMLPVGIGLFLVGGYTRHLADSRGKRKAAEDQSGDKDAATG